MEGFALDSSGSVSKSSGPSASVDVDPDGPPFSPGSRRPFPSRFVPMCVQTTRLLPIRSRRAYTRMRMCGRSTPTPSSDGSSSTLSSTPKVLPDHLDAVWCISESKWVHPDSGTVFEEARDIIQNQIEVRTEALRGCASTILSCGRIPDRPATSSFSHSKTFSAPSRPTSRPFQARSRTCRAAHG